MITKRIIPCLDVKNGRVVKGVNFEGLNDVSSPVELARYYSENGADELVFYDITASVEGRALFTDILREVIYLYELFHQLLIRHICLLLMSNVYRKARHLFQKDRHHCEVRQILKFCLKAE